MPLVTKIIIVLAIYGANAGIYRHIVICLHCIGHRMNHTLYLLSTYKLP